MKKNRVLVTGRNSILEKNSRKSLTALMNQKFLQRFKQNTFINMRNLFFGLIAMGVFTLSSFTTAPISKVAEFEDGCCTAIGSGGSVTVCGYANNCDRAIAIYLILNE